MAGLSDNSGIPALIPGSAEDLYTLVGALTQYADLLAEAGNGLSRIDSTSGWSGQAADAFHQAYHDQPSRWLQASGAFREAAQALDGYAAALSSAQQQAFTAVNLYEGGPADKAHARAMMGTALVDLRAAGGRAASAVSAAASLAPPAPTWWQLLRHGIAARADAMAHDPGAAVADVAGDAMIGASILMIASGLGAPVGLGLMSAGIGTVTAGLAAGVVGGAVSGEADYYLRAQGQRDQQAADGAGVSYTPTAPTTVQQIAARAQQLGYGPVAASQKVPVTGGGPVYSNGSSYLVASGGGWLMYDTSGKELGSYAWDLTATGASGG